jgi:hypothetical protein
MSKNKGKARPRRTVVNDPAMPLLNGIELVAPPPFKPLSPARQRAWEREKTAWRAAERERSRVRAQEHAARLARRPAEMQGRYRLPADVATFFSRLRNVWRMDHGPVGRHDEPPIPAAVVCDLIEAAYMEGCQQGFIEGFVVRREPDRQRSKTANDAKRKKIVVVAGKQMTREQRAAMMATEYASLRELMKHTPACQRLAGKYEFESWQGVAAAIKPFLLRPGE